MTYSNSLGMTEAELLDLCGQCKTGPAPWKYWTAEIYSLGKHIRKYAYFPAFMTLPIYTDHGAGFLGRLPDDTEESNFDPPYSHELKSGAPVQFYHSPVSVEKWRKVSSIPCYVLYSPFVFYRRKHRIEKSPTARGTLAFPAHSTPSIDDVSNIDEYAQQLKALPAPFQPVSVCMHMHDINKGQHRVFMRHGIPVYTAGNVSDIRFAERFYRLMRQFNYTTSNLVGSYTYYSVEMALPFSLYGSPQKFVNKADPNVTIGIYDPKKEYSGFRRVSELFSGLHTQITTEQKRFCESDLGLNLGISRIKMAKILYHAYWQQGTFSEDMLNLVLWVIRRIKSNLKTVLGKNK
jgi:hypothetical protein